MFHRLSLIFISLLLTFSYQSIQSSEGSGLANEDKAISLSAGNISGEIYGGMLDYHDVVVIVNNNSDISREIGDYFVSERNISRDHVINVSAPNRETINPSQFDDLAQQVKENLSERGLNEKINYMVTTKGVPLRVSNNEWRALSVDQGLMLIDSEYEYTTHNSYWIENPYYQDEEPENMVPFSREEYGIRLVTRLTGYTAEEAKGLVDLAGNSFGNRGNALLDMDPRKGISQGGYGVGNLWMTNAHDWMVENNHSSYLDDDNDFVTDWNDTMAYFSWGSNDGDWGRTQIANGGFESGTGTLPSGWDLMTSGGTAERNDSRSDAGSWSLKLEGDGSGPVRAYQNITLDYKDHRWIVDARVLLDGVDEQGARVYLEGYDKYGSKTLDHELYNRSGSGNWDAVQDPIENRANTTMISFILELNGAGTAFFDRINLRVIRPHNNWVPGGIAETCVSTGGRSQTYGTWYGQSLIADLIRDGVTGVKGYAFEPFLSAISHADILFPAYYSGFTLAESYWMGSQLGSWMGYVVGDPKCTPFLNMRADMGFSEEDPLVTGVDARGNPYLSVSLYNGGESAVEDGEVSFHMDGIKFATETVDISPGGTIVINLSYPDHDIEGIHEIEVRLNGDGNVWEMNVSNNVIRKTMRINTIPEVDIYLRQADVNRTGMLEIGIGVRDPDLDFSISGLNVSIVGPYGRRYEPSSVKVNDRGLYSRINHTFEIGWNYSLGYYDVEARYEDPSGSSGSASDENALLVSNCIPDLSVKLSNTTLFRNGTLAVNLSWTDPDTPDGSLVLNVELSPQAGADLEPSDIIATSNNSAIYRFDLPPNEPSQIWKITASAEDREGEMDEWRGTIRTLNGFPEISLVSGMGIRINRTGKASFVIRYSDPEGLDSREFSVSLIGPAGDQSSGTVAREDPDLSSGEEFEFEITGGLLGVGSYTLVIQYEDDEGDGDIVEFPKALDVYNIPPEISAGGVSISGKEADPGDDMVRGDTCDFRFTISDPDSGSNDFEIQALLTDSDGITLTDVPVINRGRGTFSARISTTTIMDLGSYGLKIEVSDDYGMTDHLNLTELFDLVALPPEVIGGDLLEDENGNVTVTVRFQAGRGEGLPSGVFVSLYNGSGAKLMVMELQSSGNPLVWEGEGKVRGIVNSTSVRFTDPYGGYRFHNETLDLDIRMDTEREDIETPTQNGDDSSPLWVILGVIILIFLILVIIILATVIVRSRKSKMMPAPPAIALGSAENQGVPPEALPTTVGDEGGEITSELQPPRQLEDGSFYQKPSRGRDQDAPLKVDEDTGNVSERPDPGSTFNEGPPENFGGSLFERNEPPFPEDDVTQNSPHPPETEDGSPRNYGGRDDHAKL